MDIRWHPRDRGWYLRMDSIFHGTGAASGVAPRWPLGRQSRRAQPDSLLKSIRRRPATSPHSVRGFNHVASRLPIWIGYGLITSPQ